MSFRQDVATLLSSGQAEDQRGYLTASKGKVYG